MSAQAAEGAPMKVLIVDDDETLRASVCRVLTASGYACVEASTSAEARMVLRAEQDVAAVLCDIKMVGGSGIDLFEELSAELPNLAVVMTTAVDDPQTAHVAFDLGAFGYMIKPFGVNELLINLAGALRRRDLEIASRREVQAVEDTVSRTRRLGGLLTGLEDDENRSRAGDDEVAERISRTISLRDEETGRHIERMSRYCVVLADAVGFTGLSREDLRRATALHDVGKIGVPDAILLKPGSLSPAEYAAMQRHAQIGYGLLSGSSSQLLRNAAEIAFAHHEWWDGAGYPRGLRGDEIPEEARIAAIADVFDALTSNRVYHRALSFDDAIAVMTELRGRQFEPRLLDAFFAEMDTITAIREELPDQEDEHERIRVLVVDDHAIFSQSLVRLLASRPELKVVGIAGGVAEAVISVSAYEPDVVLMDFELPDGDGPLATERVKALSPATKVIMLTARSDDQALVRALAAGCSGFVRKEDSVESLFDAIVAVHAGEMVMEPGQLGPLLLQLKPTARGLGAELTAREHEILALMREGLVNKDVAARLGVRLNTVRNQVQSILHKLQAHSKLEAVAIAVREGILP